MRGTTGVGKSTWLIPAVLMLAPTIAVLLALHFALENDDLARRQRQAELGSIRLGYVKAGLDTALEDWITKLVAGEDLAAAEAVLDLDSEGWPQPLSTSRIPRVADEGWRRAEDLERAGRFAEAAATFEARRGPRRGLALLAAARCQGLAGNPKAALEHLETLTSDPALAIGRDPEGRSLAGTAAAFALDLLAADDPRRQVFTERLARAIPSAPMVQAVFLRRRLAAVGEPHPGIDTASDERALTYRERRVPAPRVPGHLEPVPGSPSWHLKTPGRPRVAVFSEDALAGLVRAAEAGLPADPGVTVRLTAPEVRTDHSRPLLSRRPLRAPLAGWRLEAHAAGPSQEGDARRLMLLWTAGLAVALLVAVATAATRSLRRGLALAELRNDLAADVSHELRTPLAAIGLLVETVEQDRVRDATKLKSYVELIGVEHRRLSRLAENFMALARLEGGVAHQTQDAVDLVVVLEEAAQTLADRLRAEGVVFDPDVPEQLPPLTGDAAALRGVVLNLLDNALKYTGEAPRIELVATSERGGVRVDVRDDGPGLDAEARERIFERFYRGDTRLSTGVGGCGLGLAISRGVAEAHGGTLQVTSEPGSGSTFSLWLPCPEEAS